MSIIENFNELTENELQQFAGTLIQKINSEDIFSSDVDFIICDVWAEEMTGDLCIELSHEGTIEVPRKATWQCADEEDLSYVDEAEYENDDCFDAEKVFKTLSTVIDGYKVTLEVTDVPEEEQNYVEVEDYSHEDSGIGSYEFWGEKGYDSQPYIEVTGTIFKSCSCYLIITVEPAK